MGGNDSARRLLLAAGLLAIVAGVSLRVVSFTWNDRLQGDVNLFALTAREFAQNGRLHYPMKYEYSDNVDYLALHTPASQHPPLWPLVAGLLGKVLSTDNTFVVLKAMCEVIGAALLAVVAAMGLHRGYRTEAVAALSCLALSPMLVDFSANGSSYGASALILLLAIYGFVCLMDPSHYRLLDNVDLAIHEAGHVFFGPFGEFIGFLGGTLFQLIVPLTFFGYFVYRKNSFAAAVLLWWVAQNLWNISVYVKDARSLELPLVGGGEHDWAYMLGELGLLHRDQAIGDMIYGIGVALFLFSIGLGFVKAVSHSTTES